VVATATFRALVEARGFEPRSNGFLVNILRAQLSGDCRDRHCCQHRWRSV